MEIQDWLMAVLSFLLCVFSFYLLYREQESVPKSLKIYGIVTIFVITGIVLMLQLYYIDNSLIHNLKRLCLLSILAPIAYIDYKEMRIPNRFILLGIVYRGILLPFEFFLEKPNMKMNCISELIAAGILLLAAVLCRLIVKNSIGAGDIKLFFIMGLFLGLNGIWGSIFVSLVISFFAALFLLARKKKTKKDMIPFGPALAAGTMISVFLTGM